MGGFCQYCGGDVAWKDNANRFREFCEECAHRVAGGEDLQKTYDTDTGDPL